MLKAFFFHINLLILMCFFTLAQADYRGRCTGGDGREKTCFVDFTDGKLLLRMPMPYGSTSIDGKQITHLTLYGSQKNEDTQNKAVVEWTHKQDDKDIPVYISVPTGNTNSGSEEAGFGIEYLVDGRLQSFLITIKSDAVNAFKTQLEALSGKNIKVN